MAYPTSPTTGRNADSQPKTCQVVKASRMVASPWAAAIWGCCANQPIRSS